mmetsp:Transcript_8344/g.20679  ORF Transcript_8344/g.20679 Transcript_8344/m.20679 type:complete len:99 (-) Transcript_8344:226-522(-)
MTTSVAEPETKPYLQHEERVKRRAESASWRRGAGACTRRDQQWEAWIPLARCSRAGHHVRVTQPDASKLIVVSKRTKMHHDAVDDSAVVDRETSEMQR